MGHGLLHQSNTSGRIGAVLARSKDSHGLGEKVGAGGNNVAQRCPERPSRFAILRDSARYPSGPRERSAKPPFVGSNPPRASNSLLANNPPKLYLLPNAWRKKGFAGKY